MFMFFQVFVGARENSPSTHLTEGNSVCTIIRQEILQDLLSTARATECTWRRFCFEFVEFLFFRQRSNFGGSRWSREVKRLLERDERCQIVGCQSVFALSLGLQETRFQKRLTKALWCTKTRVLWRCRFLSVLPVHVFSRTLHGCTLSGTVKLSMWDRSVFTLECQ